MKKITFTLLSIILLTTLSFGQSIVNTPLIPLSTGNSPSTLDYYAKIEVNDNTNKVTLTLIGPSDRWLGLGFDATSMTSGRDIVLFDGTNLTDRTFVGVGTKPVLDGDTNGDGIDDLFPAEQDWTISPGYPDIIAGVVTVVATRDATGGDGDHKFTTSDPTISLVYARGNDGSEFDLIHHGFSNKGLAMGNFNPLGLNDHEISTFSISPNPGKSKLNLKLSKINSNTNLEVFDVLGKKIYSNRLTDTTSSIDVSKWNSGVYIVRVSADNGVQTKRFVKQ